jgi:hypothetical protein
MPIAASVGKDVFSLNGRILNNWGDGDVVKLDIPEDLSTMSTGKQGNTIYGYNYKGKNIKIEIRLILGSADDQFIQGLLSTYNSNPAAFPLMNFEFDKNVGDGTGAINQVIYQGIGGVFSKQPSAMENAAGETNQAIVTWMLQFADVNRSIN